jgi:hypothetical protein
MTPTRSSAFRDGLDCLLFLTGRAPWNVLHPVPVPWRKSISPVAPRCVFACCVHTERIEDDSIAAALVNTGPRRRSLSLPKVSEAQRSGRVATGWPQQTPPRAHTGDLKKCLLRCRLLPSRPDPARLALPWHRQDFRLRAGRLAFSWTLSRVERLTW